MLKSRADTTTKAYVRVIRKFLEWSKGRHFKMQLPFPLSVVSLYLFEVQQSCTSSSSVILAHAALKWLHSFVPSLDRNAPINIIPAGVGGRQVMGWGFDCLCWPWGGAFEGSCSPRGGDI